MTNGNIDLSLPSFPREISTSSPLSLSRSPIDGWTSPRTWITFSDTVKMGWKYSPSRLTGLYGQRIPANKKREIPLRKLKIYETTCLLYRTSFVSLSVLFFFLFYAQYIIQFLHVLQVSIIHSVRTLRYSSTWIAWISVFFTRLYKRSLLAATVDDWNRRGYPIRISCSSLFCPILPYCLLLVSSYQLL